MGTPQDHILLCTDGDSILLTDEGLRRGESVPAEYVYIDGTVGALDHSVLLERRILGEEGFITVIVPVAIVKGKAELLDEPAVISRGWVDGPEGDQLRKEARLAVRQAVEASLADGVRTRQEIEKTTRRAIGRFVNRQTGLRPMVVPVVLGALEG